MAGATDAGRDFALARYTSGGLVDATFSGDGKATTGFGAEATANDVAVQPDGRILAAGFTFDSPGSGAFDFALARYLPGGSPDMSFGPGRDGKVTTAFGRDSLAESLPLQSEGKIVLAGSLGWPPEDFALARYGPGGALDPAFSGDGRLRTDLGSSSDGANAVALQGDGKIVAAGGSDGGMALTRYTAGGSLDGSFAGDGRLRTGHHLTATDLAIQSDGKLVVARWQTAFPVHRYNPDGSPDTGFGPDGMVTGDFPGPHGAVPYGIALAGDGRIVAAGDTAPDGTDHDFAVARFADRPLLEPPSPGIDEIPPRFGLRFRARQDLGRFVRLGARCPREDCLLQAKGLLIAKVSPRRSSAGPPPPLLGANARGCDSASGARREGLHGRRSGAVAPRRPG